MRNYDVTILLKKLVSTATVNWSILCFINSFTFFRAEIARRRRRRRRRLKVIHSSQTQTGLGPRVYPFTNLQCCTACSVQILAAMLLYNSVTTKLYTSYII